MRVRVKDTVRRWFVSGGFVQVGHTLLLLECSPDGLAGRSHGIVSQSDLGWVIQRALRGIFQGPLRLFRTLFRAAKGLISSWLSLGAIVVLLYLCWPWFRSFVNYNFRLAYYTIFRLVTNLLNN